MRRNLSLENADKEKTMEIIDTKIKRIAILPVYDSEGVVHKYLEYYIKSLCEVISDLIIVVIGYMNNDGLRKLGKYSDKIYVKENKGYDAAAYKFVFENYLDIEQLNQYDELILTNDTSFGPFISFGDIFDEMGKRDANFWGLKYIDTNYISYLQSSFIVYKQVTFTEVYQYFKNKVYYDDDLLNVCIRFEQGLFKYLVKRGFEFACYGVCKGYNSYKAPDYCILEEQHPIMKKRCFEKIQYSHENCIGALLYIRNNTSYNIDMILDYVKQKYHLEYDIDVEFEKNKESPRYFVDKSVCGQKDIQFFCENNKEIYIYGTGVIATIIYRNYQEYLKHMRGFIVSDDQMTCGEHLGVRVFKISEIKNRGAGIIAAVSKLTTEMISPNLTEYRNVLYLWENH